MSHDRGCPCGRERGDYENCDNRSCLRAPLKPTSTQVGGNHYFADYQHWDWAIDVKLGALETAATKYISRWYMKNGIQDLEKTRSYVVKLKEAYSQNRVMNNSLHSEINEKAYNFFTKFTTSADIKPQESDLCLRIASWKTDSDLAIVIGHLTSHIEAARTNYMQRGTYAPLVALVATSAHKTGVCGRVGEPFGYPGDG